ncbi:NAD(+) diphosphatase [Pseudohaliea rubra]|uniref:NAD(+) diphosphatase n=1 Tax=Pseudohaliea rubra DSM 19751 TaxID=1265313 RepID=A0A095VQ88_9GAMM|nr:NAD(+) diphosphatase [Pseudohaliea rubra]KGE03535.1 NADH pyrophosphatase [Pseudohaliea rubra DSM 19751]
MFEFEAPPPDNRDDALHFVFQEGQLVSELRGGGNPAWSLRQLELNGWAVRREQFIGRWQGRPCFAVELETAQLDPMQHHCGSLYQLLGRVDEPLFALAGRAAQLLAWERDHRFCGRCGAPMVLDARERAMRCDGCARSVYPRISPCVIVLVTRGDYLLLARNARTRRPFYSTLAGFVEAGESLEHCVAREVREEVAVEVETPRYFSSQPWPFPDQLMVGFHARYASGAICCQPEEIAHADWFHYRDLPPIPPAGSIAGQLIQSYLDEIA